MLLQLVVLFSHVSNYSPDPTLEAGFFDILECLVYFLLFYFTKLLTTENYQKMKNGNQIPQIRINSNKRGKEEYQYGAVNTSSNTTKVKLRRSSFVGQTSGYVIGIHSAFIY